VERSNDDDDDDASAIIVAGARLFRRIAHDVISTDPAIFCGYVVGQWSATTCAA
jgi:hypothetical protein